MIGKVFSEFIKINMKFILFAVVILILISLANKLLRDHYLDAEVKVADSKSVIIGTLENNNETLKKQNDVLVISSKIDDQFTLISVEEKDKIIKDSKQNKVNLDEAVNKIKENYKDVDSMTDLVTKELLIKQKAKDISTVRINSLWDSYCAGSKDELNC